MSILEDAMENKKKFYIQVGIIGVCIIGGVVAYMMLSSEPPPPAIDDADARQKAIEQSMQQNPTPPPADIPRTAPRGRIQNPKGN